MAAARRKTADQDTPGLPEFEGTQVAAASVKITRAGDGLSEALRLAPEALHHGQEVWFVLKGEVTKVTHQPIPKTDGTLLTRIHTVEARGVAKVAAEAVEKLLLAEEERVQRMKEEQQGVSRLPLDPAADPLGVFDQSEPDQPGQ